VLEEASDDAVFSVFQGLVYNEQALLKWSGGDNRLLAKVEALEDRLELRLLEWRL